MEENIDVDIDTPETTSDLIHSSERNHREHEMRENISEEIMETQARSSMKRETSSQDSSRIEVNENPSLKKLKTSDSPCTCTLKLGVQPLSTLESLSSKVLDNFENMKITFHGSAGSNEQLKVREKIQEIKEKMSEYYYDRSCKVIAIPNHWTLTEKPSIIGLPKRANADKEYLNKHCEELLHHEIVRYARENKKECCVINGFQSHNCLKSLMNEAIKSRENNMFSQLNESEKKIKEILKIEDISEEKLKQSIEEHKKWVNGELGKEKSKNWLFQQELILYKI